MHDIRPLVVLHSRGTWLTLTENWIHTQVASLPDGIENQVVCSQTAGWDKFAVRKAHIRSQTPIWRYMLRDGLLRLDPRRGPAFLRWVFRQTRPDVLHSHFGPEGWGDMRAIKGTRVRHVLSVYGADVTLLPRREPVWRRRYRKLFAAVDAVLCEGPHMAATVRALACPESKVRVHHLGVRVKDIAFKPRQWRPEETLRVLMAGSFREKKGFPYGLEALRLLQREIPLAVTLIGGMSDVPGSHDEAKRIGEIVERFDPDYMPRLLGYQPHGQLFEEAYKHHVFLSPSVRAGDGDAEGGVPVAIIEMAATGMPVVSTTHCDIPNVIQHPVGGLLAPERDVAGLVAHLKWLTSHPDAWDGMVTHTRRRIEAEFNAEIQGRRLAKIYEEVVGRKAG